MKLDHSNQMYAATTTRRGSALLVALVVAVAVGGLCLAMLTVSLGTEKVRGQSLDSQRSFFAAEAGLSDAFARMTSGELDLSATVTLGSEEAPLPAGSAGYWVTIEPAGTRAFSVVSTGSDGRTQERLELLLGRPATGFFQYAAFGKDGVGFASNAFIDSYDSFLGDYASQVVSGLSYARQNGDIGSNADLVVKSNTEIHGDANPGPTGVYIENGPNNYVSGSTEPAEELVEFPPIEVPLAGSSGALVSSTDVTLGPGLVHYDQLQMNGGTTLRLVGPMQLVVDDLLMKSNTDFVFDAANGPVEVYGTGDFVLESNSRTTTLSDSAVDVKLFLSGDNRDPRIGNELQLSSNSDFVGAIYAPNAEFSLSSNFTVYGSIMCGLLDLSAFGSIHFDEALLYDGDGENFDFEPSLWRRLSPQ